MQLEAGLRKREEHEDNKDRHSPVRRGSGWSSAFHGAHNYERWVKLIALGSLGVWLLFVLFFWQRTTTPGAAVKESTAQTRDFNTHPSIIEGFPEEASFIAFGDFGTGDENQQKVALALENYTATMEPLPSFVLSTGDQIYEKGIESVDDPLLSTNFEQMYTHPNLQVPWYVTIGNHDCEGSVNAMLQYAEKKDSLWYMPRRYYTIDRPVAPKTILRLVVMDACDLVCGREPRDFRCTDRMNEQSSTQTRNEQYEWIEQVLSAGKPAGVEHMWKIVMGHWGVYSFAGNGDTHELIYKLDPLMKKYGVHAYFNGHDHSMQHVRKMDEDGALRDYFISGAGGYRIHSLKPNARAKPDLVHAAMTHGFMAVYMKKTYFRVQLVDDTGEILYTTDVPYEQAAAPKNTDS